MYTKDVYYKVIGAIEKEIPLPEGWQAVELRRGCDQGGRGGHSYRFGELSKENYGSCFVGGILKIK